MSLGELISSKEQSMLQPPYILQHVSNTLLNLIN